MPTSPSTTSTREWQVEAASQQFSKNPWSPFEGRRARARVVRTLVRGETVYADGAILAQPGSGRFLSCHGDYVLAVAGDPAPLAVKTVCYLAHCLLNANAKVDAGARCAGISGPVVALLREHGATIRQMPCPELAFGGLRRFWAVREQYDTPVFRAHCRRLALPIATQIRADLAAGARVVVLGIDGSPSDGRRADGRERGVGRAAGQAARRGLPGALGARDLHARR